MDSLQRHREYLESEWLAAQAAPLSARKAMLVAMLIDAYVDRLFAAMPDADDILDFRAAAAARSVELGRIMALCGGGNVKLVTEAVPVTDYGALAVEDFMVSLYNGQTVQRLLLVTPDGSRHDMLETLRGALSALAA